jgi:hypothetical protein
LENKRNTNKYRNRVKQRNRYRREREKERKRETDSLTARHTVIQIKEGRENERKEVTNRKKK